MGGEMLRLFFIFILISSGAQAGVEWKGRCLVFGGGDGVDGKTVCPDALSASEFRKAKKPLKTGGRTWDWTARVLMSGKRIIPDSKNAYIQVEEFVELPAAAAVGKSGGEKDIGRKSLGKGLRVMYFNEEGAMLWKRVVAGKTGLLNVQASYDGDLILILHRPDTGAATKGRQQNRIIAYDGAGRMLMSFPPGDGICRFSSFSGMWVSKTGRYMMLPCGDADNPEPPYFIQPKSGLFWRPDKLCRFKSSAEDPSVSNEEEEVVRVVLQEMIRPDPDAEEASAGALTYGENTEISLFDVEWASMKYLGKVQAPF